MRYPLTKRLQDIPDQFWMMALLLVGFGLRLHGLGFQSFWTDEAFSWLVGLLPLDQGLNWILADFVHPPLYYLVLRSVMRVGQSEFVLRLPSAMAGTIAIPLMYKLGVEMAGPLEKRRSAGLLAAALLTVNPFQIWFSQEARQYQLVLLLAIPTMYFFQRVVAGKSGWRGFVFVSALAYITHYYTLFLALIQFFYILARFRQLHRFFRRWYLAQVLAALPLVLWAIALFSQENQSAGIAWIPKPALIAPLLTMWNFALLYTKEWTCLELTALLVFAAALALSLRIRQKRGFLILWLLLPPTTILSISWLTGRNFYVDRFFIVGLPAFILLLARGALVPRHVLVRNGLLLCLLAASMAASLRIPASHSLSKPDWREAVAILQEKWQPGDLLVLSQGTATLPILYYELAGAARRPLPLDSDWSTIIRRSAFEPRAFLEPGTTVDLWPGFLRQYRPRRIWLLYVTPHAFNHSVGIGTFDIYTEADATTISWLAANRDHTIAKHEFPGVTLVLVDMQSQFRANDENA